MWIPEPERDGGTSWSVLYRLWDEIKLDFLEVYGVDLDDAGQRARVSWHWFEFHVGGLVTAPFKAVGPNGHPLPANRLQWALMPEPT